MVVMGPVPKGVAYKVTCFYLRTTAGEEQSGTFGSLALLQLNTLLAKAIFKLSNVEMLQLCIL